MKQIIEDTFYSVQNSFVSVIVQILQFVILFILLGNIILYILHDLEGTNIQNEKNGYVYHKLYQHSFNSSLINIVDEPFIIEKMEKTLGELRESKEFLFTSLSTENIIYMYKEDIEEHFSGSSYSEFLGESYWVEGENEGNDTLIDGKKPDGNTVKGLKMCKLDANGLNHYKITVDIGRSLNEEDFVYNLNTNDVNILMGAAYKPYYKIGDKIELLSSAGIMNSTVVGFLKESTNIENDTTFEHLDGDKTTLDYSIILPCFNFSGDINSIEKKMFVSLEYVSNLCGTIVFSDSLPKKERIDRIRGVNDYFLRYGIFTVITLDSTNGLIYFQGEEKITLIMLQLLIICLLVFEITTLYMSISQRIEKNSYLISVQMINGKFLREVKICYLIEIILIIGTGVVLAYLHDETWKYQSLSFQLWFWLGVLFLIGISAILVFKKIDSINIDYNLRSKEK